MRANAPRVVLLLASCIGLGTGSVQAAADLRLAVEGGNIVLIRGTTRKTLTTQKRDSESVLAPDRQWIVYTRAARPIES